MTTAVAVNVDSVTPLLRTTVNTDALGRDSKHSWSNRS